MVNLWCKLKNLYGESMVNECIVVLHSEITYGVFLNEKTFRDRGSGFVVKW